MPGDDPTQRFDYLFEPLNGGDTIEDTDDEADAKPSVGRPRLAGPARVTVAAIVLATAAATIAIVFLLMRPEHQVDTPVQVRPPTTSTSASPVATTEPVIPPPPPTPSAATDTPTVERQAPVTTAAPTPTPSSEPSSAPTPQAPLTEPPGTRPPISVQPAPRTPFPNQAPDYGSDPRGGLLGGGGLL